MLKNYFKVAWRNLVRHKGYSAINIIGLATGISACILIFLYVQDELTYERHFSQAGRIVRIISDVNFQGQVDKIARTPLPLAQALQQDYPEVEQTARLLPAPKQPLWIGEEAFTEENLIFADSTFFQIFDYDFVQGDRLTALHEPKTIVLSEELAVKYFGGAEQAMHQTVQFTRNPHKVTGVFRNPGHSHLKASAFLSANTLRNTPQDNGWLALGWFTYVLLKEPGQQTALQDKLGDFYTRRVEPWFKENDLNASIAFSVQPLRDIHFATDYTYDLSPAGNRSYLYIFGFVAVFILLIACINYMNLATARSANRAREVGMRKVVGAQRLQLIWQFMGESVLMTVLALVFALGLVEMLLPVFNSLTDKSFSFRYFLDGPFLLVLGLIVVLVGVVAGSYPAFFLSGFKPVEVLKSDKGPQGNSTALRQALVVTQFTISLILIIGTLVVFSQMDYLKNKDLGFNKERILAIDLPGGDTTLHNKLQVIKTEFLQHPNIEKVSTTAYVPGEQTARLLTLIETAEGTMEEKGMPVMFVDYDFFELMGIQVVEGRNFQQEITTDLKGAFMVNEAAVEWMNWKNPLGKKMQMADWDGKVIGVVKDFHYASLHNPLEPLVLAVAPETQGYLLARLQPTDMPATLRFIEEKWEAFAPRHPMEHFFLDENFDKQYRAEEKMLLVFGYFSILTILIACLGLYALASFTAEQRTKEIGVRKVMGASAASLVYLLTRDFARLVLIAATVAFPLAWYAMHRWLENFAYRIPISWWIFGLAVLLGLVVAVLSVGYQALKVAYANPVRSLKHV